MNGFWMVILGLIVLDGIVLAFVLRQKFGRRGGGGQNSIDLTPIHQRIADHVRANHGGHPEQLCGALRGVIPIVEEFARERDLALDDAAIELIVVTSLVGHKIATRAEAEHALHQLREDTRAAA